MPRVLLILLLVALVPGCSDDSGNNTKLDQSVGDLNSPQLDRAGKCGAGIYPCGPYGTNTADVVANLIMQGYQDPKEQCKEHKDKKLDTASLATISFANWHLGDASASCTAYKKDLLWVMVSAGWCQPCQGEVKTVQGKYETGAVDKRVGVVNVLFETEKTGTPANAAFLKTWINAFKLTMPVTMATTATMATYFDTKNPPFNMLIDTKTMKIFYRHTGADLPGLEKKIAEFFK